MKDQIAYIELPAEQVGTLKDFYCELFGWTFQSWGSDYMTFHGAGVEGGLNADPSQRTRGPLVVIDTDDIEEMQRQVPAMGGLITVPVFSFPGGRRFHFTDPAGNELAVMQADAEQGGTA